MLHKEGMLKRFSSEGANHEDIELWISPNDLECTYGQLKLVAKRNNHCKFTSIEGNFNHLCYGFEKILICAKYLRRFEKKLN